jgi:hypothetical protein
LLGMRKARAERWLPGCASRIYRAVSDIDSTHLTAKPAYGGENHRRWLRHCFAWGCWLRRRMIASRSLSSIFQVCADNG